MAASRKENLLRDLDPSKIRELNLWKKFEELHIFRAGINTLVDINMFKPDYYEDGIDFYSVGRESVFSKQNFESAVASGRRERKL